jgi:hypothetical protein
VEISRDDKEILLAVAFNKAPLDVQAAYNAHAAKLKAYNKLKVQLPQTSETLMRAEADLAQSAKAVRKSLDAWTPEA